jgi:two-component system, NarL family, sensor kinase
MPVSTDKRIDTTYKNRIFLYVIPPLIVVGLLFYVLFLLPGASSIAHEQQTEPLPAQDQHDRQLIRSAIDLAKTHPDSARSILEVIIPSIEDDENTSMRLSVYTAMGSTFFYQANYNMALYFFYKNLELALRENKTTSVAVAYQNIGLVNLHTRKYKTAVDFLKKALDIFEELNDTVNHSISLTNLGSIYLEINDLEKAHQNFAKANEGYIQTGNHQGIAAVANYKAQYFIKKNQADSALYYFDKGITYCKSANNNYGLGVIYFGKGNFLMEKDCLLESLKYFQLSDSLFQIMNSLPNACFSKLGAARVYLKLQEVEKALANVELVAMMNEKLKNEELEYKINEAYSDIYYASGDILSAFNFYQTANLQKAAISDQTEIHQIYNVELEDLSHKMKLKGLEVEKQNLLLSKRRNFISLISIAAISLVLFITFLYLFFINKINLAQKEKLHQNTIRHSFEKNKAALEAEVQERKRLGMELHDGLGPLISISKLNISNVIEDASLSLERKSELLDKTARNLDEILKEIKNISYNLAPLILIERGFEYAVKDLIARIRILNIHKINVNINGLNQILEPYLEHALYRTIQEALNNIIQHAQADEINIEILADNNEITIMIEDNGKGFVRNQDSLGLGLKSAVSRIEGLGGTLYIDSKIGRGTIITIISPLRENNKPVDLKSLQWDAPLNKVNS